MTGLLRMGQVWIVAACAMLPAAVADEQKSSDKKPDAMPAAKETEKPAKAESVKGEPAAPKSTKVEAPKVEAPKPAAADAAKPGATDAAPVKPAATPTHQLKKEPFRIDLTLQGTFESKQARTIWLRPEVWQNYELAKVAEHGARVKKGDVVVQFDTKQIDTTIADVEASRAIADLEYQAAQQQLSWLEETVPLDLAAAEKSKQYFDEDAKRYYTVEVPLAKRIADENVVQLENYLAYQKEELRQLEKMYKADDLTEETEEIILKRQRDTIARMQFSLERAKLQRDQALSVLLPREIEQVKQNEKISQLRLQSARANLPRLLAQQRLTVQKLTREREKSLDYLKRLKKDRADMTVKAPFDGVVYYGTAARGQFGQVQAMEAMLDPGAPLKPGLALLTVVSPKPLQLRTTVAEAQLSLLKAGQEAKVTPTGFADAALAGKVEAVAAVPLTPGQFDVKIAIADGGAEQVMPGMTGTAKVRAYEKTDALAAPSSAVFADENDESKKYVYIAEGDTKHRKQEVKTGRTWNNRTELLSGVKEGDRILLNKPAN